MLLNDLLGYVQTKASSAFTLSRKEGIEDFRNVIGLDTDSGVGDNEPDLVIVYCSGD